MITREEDGVWLELEETISVHHEDVFACLTTEGGLIRWFAVSAEIDEVRPGGVIVLGWDQEMAHRTTIAILDYDAGGRIVWDWLPDSGDMHAPVYWRVEPSVEEGSRVVLRQGPYRERLEALVVLAEEAQTWRWHLCNLRSVLEAKFDMRRVRPL